MRCCVLVGAMTMALATAGLETVQSQTPPEDSADTPSQAAGGASPAGDEQTPTPDAYPGRSPCAQGWDENGDGHFETWGYHLYDAQGRAIGHIRDAPADGHAEFRNVFILDAQGDPVDSMLIDMSTGEVRHRDCSLEWCRRAYVTECPDGMHCARDEWARVTSMGVSVVDTYDCWVREGETWRYAPVFPSPELEQIYCSTPGHADLDFCAGE